MRVSRAAMGRSSDTSVPHRLSLEDDKVPHLQPACGKCAGVGGPGRKNLSVIILVPVSLVG